MQQNHATLTDDGRFFPSPYLLPACGEKVPGRADEGQPVKQNQPTISSVHFWFSQSDLVW
jgi:hypothetical protein